MVFNDADLDKALAPLIGLKWRTAGQACTHANRVYVQSGVYHRFAAMAVNATRQIKVSHGAAQGTTMDSLTTSRGVEKTGRLLSDGKAKGCKVLCGGSRVPHQSGNFFEPTIISEMDSSMQLTREEVFGPLLGLYWFETEEEAVREANNTTMGLAAYFSTSDVNRTWRLLENLEARMIGMNSGRIRCLGSL